MTSRPSHPRTLRRRLASPRSRLLVLHVISAYPVTGLTPGTYVLALFAHSTVTYTFNAVQAVTVTVMPMASTTSAASRLGDKDATAASRNRESR